MRNDIMLRMVAARYRLTVEALESSSRRRDLNRARRVGMSACAILGMTNTEIAYVFHRVASVVSRTLGQAKLQPEIIHEAAELVNLLQRAETQAELAALKSAHELGRSGGRRRNGEEQGRALCEAYATDDVAEAVRRERHHENQCRHKWFHG